MSDSEKRKRTKIIMVRVTPEEKQAISDKAKDCGMTTPEYLRCCGMKRKTTHFVDTKAINELRKLGGLQKLLFNESDGQNSFEYAAILQELKAAIIRIGRSVDVSQDTQEAGR